MMMKVALLLLALAAPMISAPKTEKKPPCVHCKNVKNWAHGDRGFCPRKKPTLLTVRKRKPRCLECEDLEKMANNHGKHIKSLVDCIDCDDAWSHLEDAYVPTAAPVYNPKPAYNPYPSESYNGGQHNSYPDPKYPPSSYKLLSGSYAGDHGEVCKDCKRWKALGEEWDCHKKSGGGHGPSYGTYGDYGSGKGYRGYGDGYQENICATADYLYSYEQCTSKDSKTVYPEPTECPKCPAYACDIEEECKKYDNCFYGAQYGNTRNDASVAASGETTNETVQTLSWVLIAIAAALFLASIAFCAVGRRERKAHAAENVHVNALA